jgi:hypothetical protein
MTIKNSSDVIEDSGISPLMNQMNISNALKNKNYGNGNIQLCFVINCFNFAVKNRIRFSKINKTLYWDVILDYETVKKAFFVEKKKIVARAVINSFDVIDKYKKLELNKDAIKADVTKYFQQLEWL